MISLMSSITVLFGLNRVSSPRRISIRLGSKPSIFGSKIPRKDSFRNLSTRPRLYKRIGFVDEGRKIGAVRVNGVPVDLIEMAKVIERSSETT